MQLESMLTQAGTAAAQFPPSFILPVRLVAIAMTVTFTLPLSGNRHPPQCHGGCEPELAPDNLKPHGRLQTRMERDCLRSQTAAAAVR